MAAYEMRKTHIERREYLISVGEGRDAWASWSEVAKAVQACHQDLHTDGRRELHQEPADDDIRVAIDDGHVIVYTEVRREE